MYLYHSFLFSLVYWYATFYLCVNVCVWAINCFSNLYYIYFSTCIFFSFYRIKVWYVFLLSFLSFVSFPLLHLLKGFQLLCFSFFFLISIIDFSVVYPLLTCNHFWTRSYEYFFFLYSFLFLFIFCKSNDSKKVGAMDETLREGRISNVEYDLVWSRMVLRYKNVLLTIRCLTKQRSISSLRFLFLDSSKILCGYTLLPFLV